jgi:hypothetical protein
LDAEAVLAPADVRLLVVEAGALPFDVLEPQPQPPGLPHDLVNKGVTLFVQETLPLLVEMEAAALDAAELGLDSPGGAIHGGAGAGAEQKEQRSGMGKFGQVSTLPPSQGTTTFGNEYHVSVLF